MLKRTIQKRLATAMVVVPLISSLIIGTVSAVPALDAENENSDNIITVPQDDDIDPEFGIPGIHSQEEFDKVNKESENVSEKEEVPERTLSEQLSKLDKNSAYYHLMTDELGTGEYVSDDIVKDFSGAAVNRLGGEGVAYEGIINGTGVVAKATNNASYNETTKKVTWNLALPSNDIISYTKGHSMIVSLAAGVSGYNATDKKFGQWANPGAMWGAVNNDGYIYDNAPVNSLARVTYGKHADAITSGTDTIVYEGEPNSIKYQETLKSTTYTKKNVYQLGNIKVSKTAASVKAADQDNFVSDAIDSTKLTAWCKSMGIKKTTKGGKKGYALKIVCSYNFSPDKAKNGYTHRGCGAHGHVWRMYTGRPGNGIDLCGISGTVGKKVQTGGFNQLKLHKQDIAECQIFTFGDVFIPDPEDSSATVEYFDVVKKTGAQLNDTDYAKKECKTANTTYTPSTWLAAAPDYRDKGYDYLTGQDTSVTVTAKNITDEDSLEVYRYYAPIQYTVTYQGNGATGGSTAAQTFDYDGSVQIRANGFTWAGHDFVTWNTKPDGTGTNYVPGSTYSTNANLTLYAQWKIQAFNITYKSNGSGQADKKHDPQPTYGATPNLYNQAQSGFSRTGYQLAGWSTASGAANTVTNGLGSSYGPVTADATFYAVWNPSVVVKWDSGVDSAKLFNATRTNDKETFHPYNTTLNGFSITCKPGMHVKRVTIMGEDGIKKTVDPIVAVNAGFSDKLTECKVITIESEQDGQFVTKKVYKSGTTTDVDYALVKPGDKLDYVITSKNVSGGGIERKIVITDELDSGVTFASADNGGAFSGGKITWPEMTVADNAEKTVKYTVTVNENKIGQEIPNFAISTEKAIAALGETTDLPCNSNVVHNFVIEQPEKHLRKTATATTTIDNTVLVPGDEAVYTIKIKNPSNHDDKTFNVTDTIPVGLTPTSASDGGAITGQTVTWTGISIPFEGEKTLTVNVTANEDGQGETLKNTATATCTDAYGTSITSNEVKNFMMMPPEKSDYLTLDDNFQSNADTTDIDKEVINDGVLLTYRIKWQNPTDGKRTIKISDVVPEYARIATAADLDLAADRLSLAEKYEYVAGDTFLITDNGTYDAANKTVNWEFESTSTSDIKNQKDSGYVEFTVVILKSAQNKHVVNTAKMTIDSPTGLNENNPTMDSNTVDNPVLKTPDKIATRADGQDVTDLVVNDGEEITYKITFENPADEAKDFIVTDIVPEFTELIESSISDGGTYDANENLITWNLPGIGAHEIKTVTFTVKIIEDLSEGETVSNTARVYVDKAKKWTKDNVPPTKIFILPDPTKAVLNIDGEDINGVVKRHGDILTYEIVYKNPADTERMATVTDPLPANTEFIDATHQGSYDVDAGQFVTDIEGVYAVNYDAASHTVIWNVPTAAKCQEMVSVRVRILPEARNTILRNKASVYIPDATKWTNEVNTPVVENPTKTGYDEKGQEINGNVVTIGQELDYVIEFENPADEEKVGFITDTLPTGVTYISCDMKGRYDINTHTIQWKDISMAPHEKKTVTVKVKVNEDADSIIINNEAIYRIDEAQVSTSLEDLGEGGPTTYVSTKYVLDEKANDINKQVVTEGNTLVYKITYANVTDKERFFTIYDAFPEGVSIVDIGDNGFLVKNPIQGLEKYKINKNNTVAWQFYVLPGQEGYVTATVKVNNKQMGEIIKNNAQVMIEDDDPNKPPYILDTNFVENPCIKTPVKMVFNEAGREITDKMVTTGDIITYKITYKNPSEETKLADIRDALPNEVEFVSCDYDGTYDEATHCVKWKDIETAAHERATVSVTVKVKESSGGKTIQNKGTLTMDKATISTHAKTPESDPEDPDPDPDNPWVKNYVACKKSYDVNGNDVSGEIVKVGDTLTYRIYFKNTSSKEKNYVVKDTLPEEVDYVSASGNPEVSGKSLTWKTSLKSGGEFYYDVIVTVNEKGKGKIIKNHADITENDPDSPEDPYTVTTTDVTNPVFDDDDFVKKVMDKKGKDIDQKVVVAGDNLYYHIMLHNPSENREKFIITDKLSDLVRFVSCTKDGVYTEGDHTVKWEFELDGDAQEDIEIVVKVKKSADNATIANIAHVVTEGTEMDSNEVDNYLMPAPQKTQEAGGKEIPNGGEVKANTTVKYTLTYANPTKNGRDITITDKLDPAIVDRVLDISDNGKLVDGVITWQIDAEAGSSGEVTFSVSSPDLDGYEVHNIATVSMDDDNMTGPTTQDTNEVYFVATPDKRTDTPPDKDEDNPRKNPKKNIVKTGDVTKTLFELIFGK